MRASEEMFYRKVSLHDQVYHLEEDAPFQKGQMRIEIAKATSSAAGFNNRTINKILNGEIADVVRHLQIGPFENEGPPNAVLEQLLRSIKHLRILR
jgi:hypothetical protein